MKTNKLLLFFLFITCIQGVFACEKNRISAIHQVINGDTIFIQTKYGDVKFIKNCSEHGHSVFTRCNISVTNEMMEEADKKGITKDKVYIELIHNENCQVSAFKIKKGGELTSFTAHAEEFCKELLLDIKEKNITDLFNCPGEICKNPSFPLTFIMQ